MFAEFRKELEQTVGNSGLVLAETEDRACYGADATRTFQMPELVVFPGSPDQVAAIVSLANRHGVPLVPRGAGSGLTGGAVPAKGAVVLSFARMNRILEIDTANLTALVEPGVVTADLHAAVEARGLFYPPDPASMTFCTLGGNIAENAGGMRAVKYGVTRDYVLGLEAVLPDGRIIRTGSKCVKDVVGYDLTPLLVGCEGTLAVITRALLRLLPLPEAKKTLAATFADLTRAADTVAGIIASRILPTTLEFLDRASLAAVEEHLGLGLPEGAGAFLLVEVDGQAAGIDATMEKVAAVCRDNRALEVTVAADRQDQERLWRARRSVAVALRRISPFRVNEDIVVPRARIPEMVRRIEAVSRRYGLQIVCFGHAGDGNIHVNIMGQKEQLESGTAEQVVAELFRATVELGGRLSGEHGIGLSKQPYIGMNLDPVTLELMRSLKRQLDPNNILNPGKIFPPRGRAGAVTGSGCDWP